MARVVEEDVLGFQITIDNVEFMQVAESEADFSDENSGFGFGESALLFEVKEEFATAIIVENEIQLPFCLEGVS